MRTATFLVLLLALCLGATPPEASRAAPPAAPDAADLTEKAPDAGPSQARTRDIRDSPASDTALAAPEPSAYRGPLSGNMRVAIGDDLQHPWLFGLVHEETSGHLLAFVKNGHRHATSPGAPIDMLVSEDGGCTWADRHTVYSVPDHDLADACVSVMHGGRIGLFVFLRKKGSLRCDFVFSDDGGATWSVNTDVLSGARIFPYGPMLPYPAAVGGRDATGFAVYGYASSTGVHVATTTDNGDTWRLAGTIVTGGLGFSEASVVRVGDERKWLMFLRNDLDKRLYLSTSTDMTAWTPPRDAGIEAGRNPPYALYDAGRLHLYLFQRDFSATIGKENQLLVFEDDPETVFVTKTLSPKEPRVVATAPDRSLGYLRCCAIGRDYVWGFTAGEFEGSTEAGAPSVIVIGSTRPLPSAGPGYVARLADGRNLLRNPVFDLWTRGTDFPDLVTATRVADGFEVVPGASPVRVSREDIAPEMSRIFPFNPRHGMRIASPRADRVMVRQELKGERDVWLTADQTLSFQVWGIGTAPALRFFVTVDYGQGGAKAVTRSRPLVCRQAAGAVWMAEGTIQTPPLADKTIGRSPAVFLGVAGQGRDAPWDLILVGMKAELGPVTRFVAPDPDMDALLCSRFVQSVDLSAGMPLGMGMATGPASITGLFEFQDMAQAPRIHLADGAPGCLQAFPGPVPATGISFTPTGRHAARFDLAAPGGLSVGAAYLVRVAHDCRVTLLLDAE